MSVRFVIPSRIRRRMLPARIVPNCDLCVLLAITTCDAEREIAVSEHAALCIPGNDYFGLSALMMVEFLDLSQTGMECIYLFIFLY